MYDTDSFADLLDVRDPWYVSDVDIDKKKLIVTVTVGIAAKRYTCPECGKHSPAYDTRLRRWRHLNTMEYRTIIEADVPRVRCKQHGVLQIHVPWAEPLSRYSTMFESLVIDWLKEASVSAVAKNLGLSWNAIDGIMKRAVERGLSRRAKTKPQHISIDETSAQRRHEYVTVVTDQNTGTYFTLAMTERKKPWSNITKIWERLVAGGF